MPPGLLAIVTMPPTGAESRMHRAPSTPPDGMTQWTGRADDGSLIVVRWWPTDEVDVEAELQARWPPLGLRVLAVPGTGEPESTIELSFPGGQPDVVVDGRPSAGGWDRVESELGLFAAERLSGVVAVHAAVLEIDAGAIVIAGASRTGKTTLCVAAAEAGIIIHSDEFALVDVASGMVSGWPRPMRVRTTNGAVRVPLDPTDARAVPVALVALVAYDPEGPGLHELESGEVTMGLLANTVCARRRPEESFATLVALARRARGVGGTRGNADESLTELVRRARRLPPA